MTTGKFATMLVMFATTMGTASDMGWLQTGVRAWYVGGTESNAGGPSSNAQEANLIDRFDQGAVHVIQQQALDHWKSPLPATDWINPKPDAEGIFWINPARLQALRPPDTLTWLGKTRIVKARTLYAVTAIPFLFTLPLGALFEVSPQREILTLSSQGDGSVGEYQFDVETGLLLSKTEGIQGATTMLTISEINYDFAKRLAFAEDDGPHTAYAGRYSATRAGFLDNQGFQLYVPVVSRYRNKFLFLFNGDFMNVTLNLYYSFSYQMLYDAEAQTTVVCQVSSTTQSLVASQAVFTSWNLTPLLTGLTLPYRPMAARSLNQSPALHSASTSWQTNGTHLFCWIPPSDLQKQNILVWNLTLNRQAGPGDKSTFATSVMPSAPGFTSLTFDANGYLADLTLVAPAMGLAVDSRQSFDKAIIMEGCAYYRTQMKQALPSGLALAVPKLRVLWSSPGSIRQEGFRFFLSGATSCSYLSEYSTNLINWAPLQTNTLTSVEEEIVDPGPTNAMLRFYRTRRWP